MIINDTSTYSPHSQQSIELKNINTDIHLDLSEFKTLTMVEANSLLHCVETLVEKHNALVGYLEKLEYKTIKNGVNIGDNYGC